MLDDVTETREGCVEGWDGSKRRRSPGDAVPVPSARAGRERVIYRIAAELEEAT
jgi:hypothetical protein